MAWKQTRPSPLATEIDAREIRALYPDVAPLKMDQGGAHPVVRERPVY